MVVVGFSKKKVVNLYKTKRCGIQKDFFFQLNLSDIILSDQYSLSLHVDSHTVQNIA